ncbi:hypothetical protein [Vulcanisaeta thermophila]|nr:hypothetical protein [Vulcanisaeta thermophila]
MGNEDEKKSGRPTGSVVADCFLTWVEILEKMEKKGGNRGRG